MSKEQEEQYELKGIGKYKGAKIKGGKKVIAYNESVIIRGLYKYYKDCSYRMSNHYIFDYGETDFFYVTPTNYMCDVEIKISRSDFRADFKKEGKHAELAAVYKDKKPKGRLVPNRFTYCAPIGIIPVDEVPEYAGLIEVTKEGIFKNTIRTPYLHNNKYDIKNILLDKFYSKALKEERIINKFRLNMLKSPTSIHDHVRKFLKDIKK